MWAGNRRPAGSSRRFAYPFALAVSSIRAIGPAARRWSSSAKRSSGGSSRGRSRRAARASWRRGWRDHRRRRRHPTRRPDRRTACRHVLPVRAVTLQWHHALPANVRRSDERAAVHPGTLRSLEPVPRSWRLKRWRTSHRSPGADPPDPLAAGVFAAVATRPGGDRVLRRDGVRRRQRTREIGTRLALGATGQGIAWMVMREGSAIILTGLAIGLAAGLLAARSLRALLYSTPATDVVTLATTTGVLIATMLLACYVPARRAATVDPARTLTVD